MRSQMGVRLRLLRCGVWSALRRRYIMGEELAAMVDWVWHAFHPNGAPLSPEQRALLARNLLAKVDHDSDGRLMLDEFKPWFDEARRHFLGHT